MLPDAVSADCGYNNKQYKRNESAAKAGGGGSMQG